MKKSLIKRVMAFALSLIMVIGLMPMTATAATTSVPGDAKGQYLDNILSYTWGNSSILVYATPGAYEWNKNDYFKVDKYSTITKRATIYYPKCGGYYQCDGDLYCGGLWRFAGVETYYIGSNLGLGVIKVEKENPKFDGPSHWYYFNFSGNAAMSNGDKNAIVEILKEATYEGTYYVSFIYEPIVTVNAGEGVTATVSGAVNRGGNRYSIKYGNTITVSYEVDDKYVVTDVHGNLRYNLAKGDNKVSGAITEPGSINIDSRLKRQIVNFNANGGEGTMAAQTFEHSAAQALTANTFTRPGYLFAGWNTAADGSGTGYVDKASATFTPANDGDSITLYAQWTQCNSHTWEDGKCTECGALCSHSGGNATCTALAVCETCGKSYGEYAKHNAIYTVSENKIVETCTAGCGHTATAELVIDDSVSTVYTGSAIKALKGVYSDNCRAAI